MAVAHFAQLVGAHLVEGLLTRGGVAPDGDLRGHAAHSVHAAPMAGLHHELRVGSHARLLHGHLRAIGQQRGGIVSPGLDEAEDVVPAAAVESRRVIAQLPEDLVHLERRREGLDQDRGLDTPGGQSELPLRLHEDLVPEPGLEMALELGQIEVRPGAAVEELARVVEHEEREVDERAGRRRPVDDHVPLGQMQTAGPHHQRGDPRMELVVLAGLGVVEGDHPPHRVTKVHLPGHQILPGRRGGILEVRHEHVGARVERVDDHLAIDGTGDLDRAFQEIAGSRRYLPIALADRGRFREKTERLATGPALASRRPGREELREPGTERAHQAGSEPERGRRENLFVARYAGSDYLGARGCIGNRNNAQGHLRRARGRRDTQMHHSCLQCCN